MKVSLTIKKIGVAIAAIVLVSGQLLQLGNTINTSDPVRSAVFADNISGIAINYDSPITNDYQTVNEAKLDQLIEQARIDPEKVRKVETYLKNYGSPMYTEAETFVKAAYTYDLPYNLLPAIAIIESGGGKYNYRPYNYAGMGGQGNALSFTNYTEAIFYHAKFIREGYYDKGADTPEEMELYYCYQCPTWGEKVQGVMNVIDSQ